MAYIKKKSERKFKITVCNGYKVNGQKRMKAQTITVPSSVPKRGIQQYVMAEAERIEKKFKYGVEESDQTHFDQYAENWLKRQQPFFKATTYAGYKRNLDIVYPLIGGIPLAKLLPMTLEEMCEELRKRPGRGGNCIKETTVQKYLETVSSVLEDAKKKGYETTVNIMAVSKVNEDDLETGLELLAQSSVDVIYLVDSFGAFYPEQIERLSDKYLNIAAKYNKKVGIHAHNNQQLAFANTIEAMTQGVSYLDATVDGMGRGAGNCALELLLGFLKNPKYQVAPILKIIEEYTHKFKAEGVKWGYDIPYLLTGQYNTHPRPAIQFVKEDRQDYYKFSNELYDIINS